MKSNIWTAVQSQNALNNTYLWVTEQSDCISANKHEKLFVQPSTTLAHYLPSNDSTYVFAA